MGPRSLRPGGLGQCVGSAQREITGCGLKIRVPYPTMDDLVILDYHAATSLRILWGF